MVMFRSVALLFAALVIPAVRADETPFGQRVAPVLKSRCLECHNAKKSRGGLDLSTRQALLKGGDNGPAVVPGQSGKSLIIEQVSGAKPSMPKKGTPLTPTEVAELRKWIDSGATWPASVKLVDPSGKPVVDANWWSLRPLSRPGIPEVRGQRSEVRNAVDAFVVAKLEEKGLKLSPEADRLTLLRRVTFDLTGLPPTPEEMEAARNDKQADWYEKVVERLLASPAYGERWGRHWLDVVHYADTHGYDKDKRRDHAWPYRDYVIRSLNDDKPYPQFIREQIAGDVLFPGKPEGIVATGFIAAGPWDFVGHVELREGTVDKMKTRLVDRDDMLSSTMSTFVSMTVHCARCHDHKFDPIAQTDYYRLQAVFAGVDRGDRPYETTFSPERRALEARRDELRARQAALQKKIDGLNSPDLARIDGEVKKLRGKLAALPQPKDGGPSPSNGWHSGIEAKPDVVKWVQIDLGKAVAIDEVRLLPARPTDFRDAPGFGFPVRFKVEVSDDPTFARAETIYNRTQSDYPNPGDVPHRVQAGKQGRYVRVTALRLWKRTDDYCFALAEMQVMCDGKNVALGTAVTALDSIEAGRWSRRYLVDGCTSRVRLPAASDALIEREKIEQELARLGAERETLLDKLIDADTRRALAETARDLGQTEEQIAKLSQPAKVYAALPHAPRPIHVLPRGDVEKPGPAVGAGAMACVPGLPSEFKLEKPEDEGARRAALAEWIASPKNPLTWRSIANRVWHYHFGRGIVDTPNDFGGNGGRPTHPELLDWLACEFRDTVTPSPPSEGGEGGVRGMGGSFKQMHRLIVTSRTYRQQSRHDEAAAKLDADNRLLWRMNRARLDAESIRDSVLAVSGKLDRAMGGPGFELFRFKDDHSPIYDHTALEKINDPHTYRRTVYRFTVRSVPNPFLDCLDCADPNVNTPVRNATLTALQALSLLNNPFMVKQAELFAERLARQGGDLGEQVERGCRLAFGRAPSPGEREALTGFARKHGLAAVCRLLLNANEFVFVD